MQHSKRQRLTRLFLFGTLFAAGALFQPELRAGSLREPVPEFVAEHLPAMQKLSSSSAVPDSTPKGSSCSMWHSSLSRRWGNPISLCSR